MQNQTERLREGDEFYDTECGDAIVTVVDRGVDLFNGAVRLEYPDGSVWNSGLSRSEFMDAEIGRRYHRYVVAGGEADA